ncbi:MAG: late competence development ComFB family protein [Spirochaetales bacterium]|nr:late competence development ComFB family protein [Spirochaetales bacterium]
MKPHNLMEELVINTVDDIFSNEDYLTRTGCPNSDQCRIDVVCYVLNRIPPLYTTSSRGLAHLGKTYIEQPQSTADIAALVNEGIRQVATHQRPSSDPASEEFPEPPMFNFPIIKGQVFDGRTFAPYSGSAINLKSDYGLVPMRDNRWNNPCPLIEETEGRFLFWPMPVSADKPGEERTFSFALELEADGYKQVRHFITFNLTSDDKFVNSMEVNRIYTVESIYLFDQNEPEEIIQ